MFEHYDANKLFEFVRVACPNMFLLTPIHFDLFIPVTSINWSALERVGACCDANKPFSLASTISRDQKHVSLLVNVDHMILSVAKSVERKKPLLHLLRLYNSI